MKIVTLYVDDSPQNPAEDFDDGFKVVSFGRRHRAYRDPEEYFPNGKPALWLRNKLRAGTAFILSYFEHGNCQWSLRGEGWQDQWDSVDVAGLLIWEGKPGDLRKTPAERRENARIFIETYTAWCNGEVYGYSVEEGTPCGECGTLKTEMLDSCFGFYGNDTKYMKEQIVAALDGDTEIEVRGDASGLFSANELRAAVEKAREQAPATP